MAGTTTQMDHREYPCEQCGATVQFKPGTDSLTCPYCGHVTAIASDRDKVRELDFLQHLEQASLEEAAIEQTTVHCSSCGAESTLDPNVTAEKCPFCGTPLVASAKTQRVIRPQSLLPFRIPREKARDAFQKWIKGLWFAPNALKKMKRTADTLQGIYVPYWTYDCHAETRYTGQRGEHYWDTETYTTRENGRTVTKTRRVQKTRWYPASGTVWNNFDDILVLASRSLPANYADKLEPWDLPNLVSYQDDYLSGFRAEAYQVNLAAGFDCAKNKMVPTIRQTIERDIGGDEQSISSMDSSYSDISFKHILLPIWLSAYRYKEKTYRFLVNARTGEVQGERPWSWVKITLVALAVLGVIALIALGVYMNAGSTVDVHF